MHNSWKRAACPFLRLPWGSDQQRVIDVDRFLPFGSASAAVAYLSGHQEAEYVDKLYLLPLNRKEETGTRRIRRS